MATNLAAIGIPNVIVNTIPPSPLLNGVPSNVIGIVGTATYGAVNSPTIIGTLQDYVSKFGNPQNAVFDLGTPLYNAVQQGANSFVCVRVTDETDVQALADILDEDDATGAVLSAKYTGTLGNTINAALSTGSNNTDASPSYKLTIYFSGGVPEVFDNISGTGVAFWTALVDAVNLGQGNNRPPSQICVASLESFISSVTVDTAGSYATLPTFGTSGNGTGEVLSGTMKAASSTVAVRGTGYVPADTITLTGGTHTINSVLTVSKTELATISVNAGGSNYLVGDTITLAGGTFSTPVLLTVSTVSGGAVTGVTITNRGAYTVNTASFTQSATSGVGTGATFNTAVWGVNSVTVSTPGAYTALPSSPVAQGSTSGSGTGATFTVLWGLLSIQVNSAGSGFDDTSEFTVTGGGGTGGATGTLNIGSAGVPVKDSYQLSGGTNGNTNVTDADLIGVDTGVRTGMYALRSTLASISVLSDQTDSTYWTNQISFGLSERQYMIGTMSAGYYSNISGAVSAKQTAGIGDYSFKLMLGDWIYINDPFNNVTRLTSPQGFVAGILSVQQPSGSSLNKKLNGVVATQKTAANTVYSDADLLQLQVGGIDVITKPIPASSSAFGVRLGLNTSGSPTTNGDNYTRMVNFLADTFEFGLGDFIGLPQTPDVQRDARNTLQSFLQNLNDLGLIGTIDGTSPFRVTLDLTNNPINSVALGFMIADIQVTLYSIILQFVINLQAGQSVQIQVLPTQLIA